MILTYSQIRETNSNGEIKINPFEEKELQSASYSDLITMLSSLNRNVGKLTREVRMLKWSIPLIVTFGIAVIAVITAFVK